MSYHVTTIKKGKTGEFSKITEEYLEAQDAFEQKNKILLLTELSDLVAAIEAHLLHYNMTIDDLLIMKKAKKNAKQKNL